MLTTVENGIAIKVQGNPDHPQTGGVLCTKLSRYTERTYHPERILHPLKRTGPKGSGQFARVGWDEALSDIALRLKTIAGRTPDAAQAIVEFANKNQVDHIVMGARGHSAIRRYLGSVSAQVVAEAECSVTVVRV